MRPFSDGWYAGVLVAGGLWAVMDSPAGTWGKPFGVFCLLLGLATSLLGWYAQYLRAKLDALTPGGSGRDGGRVGR